jgi:hypothetical protein
MGEPAPVPAPPRHPTQGKPPHRTTDRALKGKIAIRGLVD